MTKSTKGNLLKALGPGLLWAGAAIGVSHLVQSTRAGAGFGFELVWIIILANLLKYPFFEFAPRYAASTGEHLIQGYQRLGKWAVVLYGVLTVATMFTLMAAVTVVTGSVFASVFGGNPEDLALWSSAILLLTAFVIIIGKYSLIDRLVKVIIILLAISTIIAVFSAAGNGFNPKPEFSKHFDWALNLGFLLALVGWMPTAIDVSVWHSVWTIEKTKSSGYKPKLKESLFDFRVGYFGTAILSLGFLSLGALIMYGTGNSFSLKGTVFAGQLIELFTSSIGTWAYPVIAVAALATMTSTTLTCLDAYPRVLEPTTKIIVKKLDAERYTKPLRFTWLFIVIAGTILIFFMFMSSMKTMVDIATILSFLTAPVLGWLNLKAVTSEHVPAEARPGKGLLYLSYVGIGALFFVGAYYIYFLCLTEKCF